MNERERLTAVDAVRSAAAQGKIIIAGTGQQSAAATIAFTNRAAGAGADYALAVTPFYYKSQMTAEALEQYYRDVAGNVRIPVIIYSVSKFTGIDMPLAAVLALKNHPNIAGMKESSGNIGFLGEVARAGGGDFSMLQGVGSALYASLVTGAQGGILALSDMAPRETVDIYEAFRAGDYERARKIQLRIVTVNQKIVGQYGVPGIKHALDLLGYHGGDPRPPLRPVSREIRNSIKDILTDAGLL